MNNKGFIKLHRKILDNWIYGINSCGQAEEPFDRTHAWIDILLLANYEQTKKMYKGNLQVTNAGEIQTSIEALAYRWGWNRKKVDKFLNMLEADSMITQRRTASGTTLTVEKWGFWQGQGTTGGTTGGTAISAKKQKKGAQNGTTDGTGFLLEIPTVSGNQGTTVGTSQGITAGTSEGIHNKNIKNIKNSALPDMAKKPSGGAIRIGEILTDADGFRYIKKADGTIDRYRGENK